MLTINIVGEEQYDEESNRFLLPVDYSVELEHSLVSLSKWESEWCKPFLDSKEKTVEETYSYIEHMVVGEKPPPDFLKRLRQSDLEKISAYLGAKGTATTFFDYGSDANAKKSSEVFTSETIYYLMASYQIPFVPCDTWNLNRLMTLIRVFQIKNEKPKKMSRADLARRNAELNRQRREQLKSNG